MVEAVRTHDPDAYVATKNELTGRGWDVETVGSLLGVCLLALTLAVDESEETDDRNASASIPSVLEYVQDDLDGWFADLTPGLRTRLRSMTSVAPDAVFHEAALAALVGELDDSLLAVFVLLTAAAVERSLAMGTEPTLLYEHLSWGARIAPDLVDTILNSASAPPLDPPRIGVDTTTADPRWSQPPQCWPALVSEVNRHVPADPPPDLVDRRRSLAYLVAERMSGRSTDQQFCTGTTALAKWALDAEPRRSAIALLQLLGAPLPTPTDNPHRSLETLIDLLAETLTAQLAPDEDPIQVMLDLGRYWGSIEMDIAHNAEFVALAYLASDLTRPDELYRFLEEVAAGGSPGDTNRVYVEVIAAMRWTHGVLLEHNLNALAARAAVSDTAEGRLAIAESIWPTALTADVLDAPGTHDLIVRDARRSLEFRKIELGAAWESYCADVFIEVLDRRWREYLSLSIDDPESFIEFLSICLIEHVARVMHGR